jgi:hypothetical protein
MSDVTLENTPENQQLSRLQQLVSEQNWPQAYDLVATALQGKNISSGVSYFFQNAGALNGDTNSAANIYIRTAYKTAAALQGVDLSDSQVQAVSGSIAENIFNDILQHNGTIVDDIAHYVDQDVSVAVTQIPGVSQTLSMATWGPALFVRIGVRVDFLAARR